MLRNLFSWIKRRIFGTSSIILYVQAKHFIRETHNNTFKSSTLSFTNHRNCPLAKAAKEQFRTNDVSEVVTHIIIDGKTYQHNLYGFEDYEKDLELASKSDPERVIREILLN